MKSATRMVTTSATLLCLVLLATDSFAATKPLLGPTSLALDAKGNLYASSANSILIYNPNYVQLTGKTITQGISYPLGLAFDASGNLWVSNLNPLGTTLPSVTMYSNGVQDTSATITGADPSVFYKLAFDGLGNL